MYELFVTLGRFTYNYGLFETEFIDEAKNDLQEHYPEGKVFAVEKEINVLRFDEDDEDDPTEIRYFY